MKLEIQPIIMWNSSIKVLCFSEGHKIRTLHFTFFLLLYGLLCGSNVYGINDSIKLQKAIVFDSSSVEVRQPLAEQQQELLNNKDYKYDHKNPASKTLWERIKEWFWQKINDLFNTKSGAIGLIILKYVLIVTAIALIIMLLLKNNIRALFYGKSAGIPIDFKEFDEDIHKINFNELISTAVSEKDYRRAVRLHFLKLLKELTDKSLITWKIDKTNNDYSIELSNSEYEKQFKELAISYEYIWYGNFILNELNFKTTIEKFKQFEREC